jgi:hypothetical protein
MNHYKNKMEGIAMMMDFEDGKNSNSFNKNRDSACSEYGSAYEDGFSAGCQSVEGNTNDAVN